MSTAYSAQLLPDFPALRCYAFSPPGAVVSAHLAAAMELFVMSPLVCCRPSTPRDMSVCVTRPRALQIGSDLVPRMSLPSLQAVVAEVAHAMARAKVRMYANRVALLSVRLATLPSFRRRPNRRSLQRCAVAFCRCAATHVTALVAAAVWVRCGDPSSSALPMKTYQAGRTLPFCGRSSPCSAYRRRRCERATSLTRNSRRPRGLTGCRLSSPVSTLRSQPSWESRSLEPHPMAPQHCRLSVSLAHSKRLLHRCGFGCRVLLQPPRPLRC